EHVRWLNRDGKHLNEVQLPLKDVPAIALHRADLQSVLVRALPQSSINLDHEFVSCDLETNHIRVTFKNKHSIVSDALIGADGLHSEVRQQLLDDSVLSYRSYMVWRGIATKVPSQLTASTAIEIHGQGRRFGIGPVGLGRIGWWASANENGGKTEATDE